MIDVAVDTLIGPAMQEALARRGVRSVITAQPREPDESWVRRAAARRVDAVLSQDGGVGRLCEQAGLAWVQLPSNTYLLAREIIEWIEIVTGRSTPYPPPEVTPQHRERIEYVVSRLRRSSRTLSQIARMADVDYDAAHDVLVELVAAGRARVAFELKRDGRPRGHGYLAAW